MSWSTLAIVVLLAGACGDSSGPGGPGTAGSSGGSSAGHGGSSGTTGSAGTMGAAGTMGNAGRGGNAGSAGRGGTTGAAGTAGGGAMGTQPIGAACANTANCSQADGAAVCCLAIPACTLANQCPTSPNYVPCTDTASCIEKYTDEQVRTFPGAAGNLKVTYAQDVAIAARLLKPAGLR